MRDQKITMDFIAPALYEYVVEPPLRRTFLYWKELARETHWKVLQPRMLSGALQDVFLVLTKLLRPKRILKWAPLPVMPRSV